MEGLAGLQAVSVGTTGGIQRAYHTHCCCVAFLASLTALGVYEGEERRHKFERMRHSHESYREFNIATSYKPTILPCLEALLELDNKELPDLLKYSRELKFRYQPSSHAALTACLRRDSQEEDPPTPETWTLTETRLVCAKILPRSTRSIPCSSLTRATSATRASSART